MNLSRLWIIALLLTSLPLLHAAPVTETDNPTKVVQDLYHYSQAHFGFTPELVKGTKPWLAPELFASIWKKVNQPVPKGDAPDIEGDLFLDSQEGPTKVQVGQAAIEKTKARVNVTLTWTGETRHQTVLLEQVNGAWKVYDVDYGDKEGKLTDLLK